MSELFLYSSPTKTKFYFSLLIKVVYVWGGSSGYVSVKTIIVLSSNNIWLDAPLDLVK